MYPPPAESPAHWPCPAASSEQHLRAISGAVSQATVLTSPQIKLNSQLSCCAFFKCKAISIPSLLWPSLSTTCLLPSLSGYKDEILGLAVNYSSSAKRFIQNVYVPRGKGLNKVNSIVVQLLTGVWLCNPMGRNTPDSPVLHHLLECAQAHVHRVGDATQPSRPLPPSSPALHLSQHQGLFQWVSSWHQVAKILEHKCNYTGSFPGELSPTASQQSHCKKYLLKFIFIVSYWSQMLICTNFIC